MVDFGPRWERLFEFGFRFMTCIIFTTFYDPFFTDADEEVNKWTRAYARVLRFVRVYVSFI